MKRLDVNWLYPLKRRLILGILGIVTLSIAVTTLAGFFVLRDGLTRNSRLRTLELGSTVKASITHLMMTREPDRIQDTLEALTASRDSIVKAFILDRQGMIVYSSDRAEIGRRIDRFRDKSCRACHQRINAAPPQDAVMIDAEGGKLFRNVMVIYNDRPCYRCHEPSDRINGKLIIDRSLKDTYALIALVEAVIFGAGLLCLAVLIPFLFRLLSRGLDAYIRQIVSQHTELSLLYLMIERLSKTIDAEELKVIIIDIYRDTLHADEIDIVFPRDRSGFRAFTWNRRENDIIRKKISTDDPLFPVVEKWLDGAITETAVSAGRREITMPIVRAGVPLAFIVARKTDAPFPEDRVGLIDVMVSHISVALENARLYTIAITDDLTRLYTHRHFRTCIDKSFGDFQKYGERFSLLLVDLDDFKRVNDTHGHPAGDSVLREAAQVLLSSVRDNDLVFRYGGEEFAILLPGTGGRGCSHVAERIRNAFEAHVFEQGKLGLRITVSAGCATCPDTADAVRDLILAADKFLYEAKRTGKNRVVSGDLPSQDRP